ncbi:hypothetical protein [Bhargavaea ginsengi]|uniref:hypothetical protein n=1 Tax=Bhargavaea ginsengi TaxID=426757 RepID=UPI003C73F600
MDVKEFHEELKKVGLSLLWEVDKKKLAVWNPNFANPLLWMDAYEEDYKGNVRVKSINAPLFTEEQIRKALILSDEFLQTPLEDRGL